MRETVFISESKKIKKKEKEARKLEIVESEIL
jgi:hypothetical protein